MDMNNSQRNDVMLSIIVPVYKTEQYLNQCVDSILAQTIDDYELILVDDGSPDNSGAICDGYAARFPNIRVIHKPNGGLTAARKSGMEAARGKYVAFVDSDDWIDPDMYAVLVAQAEEHGADLVSCGYIGEYDDHTVRYCDAVASGVYTGDQLARLRETAVFSIDQMCQGLSPSTCTKVYLRESAAEIFLGRTDSVSFGEDALFTYPVVFRAGCVVVNNEHCAYHYRRWGGSITGSYNKKYFDDLFTLYDRLHAAAENIRTEAIDRAIAYNYAFLYLNGLNHLMGRSHRVSYLEKYRIVKKLAQDGRLARCMELVEPDRFPKHADGWLRRIARGQAGAFVATYLMGAVSARLIRR